tara:strand:- start:479 stop:1309 length:831 start_codon:yes stop_codon:yes gene_type:complete
MAIYDDFLSNDLYARPSSMMSNVNNYLGVDNAKLPQSADTLGGMAGLTTQKATNNFTKRNITRNPVSPPGPDIEGIPGDSVGNFVKDISVLNQKQRNLLLQFINSPGGVEPSEYAELFNVPEEYSNRFQGLPNLLNLSDQISNIEAYGGQQRGYEMDAAQQANIAAQSGGRGQLVGRRDDSRRKTMINTLTQRLSGIQEAEAGKYNQLLQTIQNSLSGGFQTQADIYAGGAPERDPTESRFREGETQVFGGKTYYWYQGEWITEEAWDALEETIEG